MNNFVTTWLFRALLTGTLMGFAGWLTSQAPARTGDWADLPSGHLVICGGGKLPIGVRTQFVALAGGSNASLVVIPTASARADNADAAERYLSPWREFEPTSLVLAHERNRSEAKLADIAARIAEATGVWISGGDQSRLTTAYAGTAVERALHELLARDGVLGGTSAGAACMSLVMITGGRTTAAVGVGFDFLPGAVVDQHFSKRGRSKRLAGVLREHAGRVGFGIDERTALITRGRRATIWGDGSVQVLLAPGRDGRDATTRAYHSGATLDLRQLARAARERAGSLPGSEPPTLAPLPSGVSVVVVGDGDLPSQRVARVFLDRIRAHRSPGERGRKAARVAVLTTACTDPVRGAAAWITALEAAGADADPVDAASRTVADGAPFARALAAYDAVWFAGDQPWLLIDRYADTATLRALRKKLRNGGGVVGAASYAAHALGTYLLRGHPLDTKVVCAEGYSAGLGLLPGWAIETHQDTEVFTAAVESNGDQAADFIFPGGGNSGGNTVLALPPGAIVLFEGQVAKCVAAGAVAGRAPRILAVRDKGLTVIDLQAGSEALDWRDWLDR